jgi:TubC N-terminal docking domain
MTLEMLLTTLTEAQATLRLDPHGVVHCRAPRGVLTPDVKQQIALHKPALVAWLQRGQTTATTATPSAVVTPATIPRCGHDPIFWERQRDQALVCRKCVVLESPHPVTMTEHLEEEQRDDRQAVDCPSPDGDPDLPQRE